MTQFYNEKSANFRIYIQPPVSGCDCSLFLVNNPSGDLNLSVRMCVCEGLIGKSKQNAKPIELLNVYSLSQAFLSLHYPL